MLQPEGTGTHLKQRCQCHCLVAQQLADCRSADAPGTIFLCSAARTWVGQQACFIMQSTSRGLEQLACGQEAHNGVVCRSYSTSVWCAKLRKSDRYVQNDSRVSRTARCGEAGQVSMKACMLVLRQVSRSIPSRPVIGRCAFHERHGISHAGSQVNLCNLLCCHEQQLVRGLRQQAC